MGVALLQGSGVRGQGSGMVRGCGSWTRAFPYFGTLEGKLGVLFWGEVAAIPCEIELGIRFTAFSVAIGQLAHEVRRIPALHPSLTEALAHRAGRAPDLTRQRVPLLSGKSSAD